MRFIAEILTVVRSKLKLTLYIRDIFVRSFRYTDLCLYRRLDAFVKSVCVCVHEINKLLERRAL